MRRPVWMYAVPALVAGLLSGQTLAAQAHMGGGKDAMPTMANCSMMSSMMTAMEGPGAALSKRKELGLSAAQVTQLEALRATEMQAMKQPMDSMMALHKQLAALADARSSTRVRCAVCSTVWACSIPPPAQRCCAPTMTQTRCSRQNSGRNSPTAGEL